MNKPTLLLTALLLALCLTACNTVRGIGKDIEKGGEAIQRATH
jgi:predicted small secreted protein